VATIEKVSVPQGRTFLDWTRYTRRAKACLKRVREIQSGEYWVAHKRTEINRLMREATFWSGAASRMILVRKGIVVHKWQRKISASAHSVVVSAP
jgi:hypothetical protein